MPGVKKWVFGGLAGAYALLFGLSLAIGAGMTVGAGAQVSLGSGVWDMGCNDLLIDASGSVAVDAGMLIQRHMENQAGGTLHGGTGSIDVFGDWKNQGTFIGGSGTVSFLDGCGVTAAVVTGESELCNFVIASSTGKMVAFEAGKIQKINCSLNFNGVDGNLLVIRSATPGSQAFINLAQGATQNHIYEDVADLSGTGQWIAPGPPETYKSKDSGGNSRWFFQSTPSLLPVPTLSQWGFAMLALLMMFMGGRVLMRRLPPTNTV